MAVYPRARYRPLNQFSNGAMHSYRGVVLHVNDSDGPSLYNWIAGGHDMSCHFQVAKDGTIEQYIDTANSSWCQADGNNDWLSVETQGFPTEPLTPAQVDAIRGIVSWAHLTHGIPLQLAETPAGTGLGWHGMGGDAWGGHPGCPGDLRKAQRAEILQEDDMTPDQDAALTRIDNFVKGIAVHGTGTGATVINTTAIKVNAIAVKQAAQLSATGVVDVNALADSLVAELTPDLAKALLDAMAARLSA
jgi:hypothetical protein